MLTTTTTTTVITQRQLQLSQHSSTQQHRSRVFFWFAPFLFLISNNLWILFGRCCRVSACKFRIPTFSFLVVVVAAKKEEGALLFFKCQSHHHHWCCPPPCWCCSQPGTGLLSFVVFSIIIVIFILLQLVVCVFCFVLLLLAPDQVARLGSHLIVFLPLIVFFISSWMCMRWATSTFSFCMYFSLFTALLYALP